MYTRFFGLNEKPFAITPDPRYLYLSERHAEALAHLVYGISEAGGFIQLTGEVGTGKTTLLRSLLGQIPENAEIAFILNPRITPAEFLLTICEELGIGVPDSAQNSLKDLIDILNDYLLAAHGRGRRVVVIVDEAQNLSTDMLEQVRLLTNLETPTQKLLQILLIGQPELRDVLKRNDLRQLSQRITGRYHLSPLSRTETAAYVRHRLKVAGATGESFTNGALREIHRLARGIPRVINVICDRSLLGAYAREQHRIDSALVRRSVREIYGRPVLPAWGRWAAGTVVGIGALLLAFGMWRQDLSGLGTQAKVPIINKIATNKPLSGKLTANSATNGGTLAADSQPIATRKALALADFMKTQSADAGLENAFQQLFTLWGAPFEKGDVDGCQQALNHGLECVVQRGSWGQLRAFNRPVILMLADDTGKEYPFALAELGDDRVTLLVDGQRRHFGIGDVSKYWFGDFVLLWKPQVAGGKQLSAGMHSDEVRWLRQALEHVRGLTPTQAGAEIYDAALVKLVEDFQRQHHLTVDGIAGLQTQMFLDAALETPGTPLLTSNSDKAPAAPDAGSTPAAAGSVMSAPGAAPSVAQRG